MKVMPAICIEKPNKSLQLALRKLIAAERGGVNKVAKRLRVGPDTLGRYLADLPLRTATFKGIEAILSEVHATGAGGK